MEGTENMSDDIFENRHSRLELCERKRKRYSIYFSIFLSYELTFTSFFFLVGICNELEN